MTKFPGKFAYKTKLLSIPNFEILKITKTIFDFTCREDRGRQHPNTPDVHQVASKRAFDGQVKKWRRMLHAWDLPGDIVPSAMPSAAAPQTDSKNEEPQRQTAAGLPLKMSAMRPANNNINNKRSRSFLAALLSPTMAPPESKVQKKTEGEPVVQEQAHPSQALMAKWRNMVTGDKENTNGPQNDAIEMIDAAVGAGEEVSYSEDEDEAVPMQADAATVVA